MAPEELGEEHFVFIGKVRPRTRKDDPPPRTDASCELTLVGGPDNDTLTGGPCDDTLDGKAGDDTLSGLGGDDLLIGGLGADTLDGGDGFDYAGYRRSPQGVRVELDGTKDSEGYIIAELAEAHGDRLRNIEGILGSDYGDVLTGDDNANRLYGYDGADTLTGGGGNDLLHGGPGADTLDGGAGTFDYADYRDSPEGVTIDFSQMKDADGYITASGGDAGGDKLKNIKVILGSAHDDTLIADTIARRGLFGYDGDDTLTGGTGRDELYGDEGDDVLTSGPGNDLLYGGPGADTLDGGAGRDIADYRDSPAGVTIDFSGMKDANGYITASGGDAQGDKLKNIEQVWGSGHADTLTADDDGMDFQGFDGNDRLTGGDSGDVLEGDAGNDILTGGPGGDVLEGGPGGDVLEGGPGNDTLTGGADDDSFVFNSGDGNDVITDFSKTEGDDIDLQYMNLTGFNDLTITKGASDTVISVDDISITLQDFTDTLVAGDFIF